MFNSPSARNGTLAMLGGSLFCIVLALDDVEPQLVGLAVIVPVLLGFGVFEFYRQFNTHFSTLGKAAVALTTIGLVLLFLAVILYSVLPPSLIAVIITAVPGVTGVVVLAVGSAFLALTLYRREIIPISAAVLLGTGIVFTPILGLLISLLVAPHVGTAGGILTGLSGTIYGIGWIMTGYRLQRTPSVHGRLNSTNSVSPNKVTTLIVSVAFVLLSVGRFVPLGPLSGTPWVNQSLVLDSFHLGSGLVGLAIIVFYGNNLATYYNQIIGTLSLVIATVSFIGPFQDIRSLNWVLVDMLGLNMPDAILHVPVAVLLLATGFLTPELD